MYFKIHGVSCTLFSQDNPYTYVGTVCYEICVAIEMVRVQDPFGKLICDITLLCYWCMNALSL